METMKRNHILTALVLLCCPCLFLIGNSAAEEHMTPDMALYAPADLQWKPGPPSLPPGAQVVVLEGDMTKEGPFVIRARFPGGYHIPPHTHPKTEHITVISGNFMIAMGEKLDRASARSLPAGSFGMWPAGMKHTVWVEGETIVQLHGTGPWGITYLNLADDPRNKKESK